MSTSGHLAPVTLRTLHMRGLTTLASTCRDMLAKTCGLPSPLAQRPGNEGGVAQWQVPLRPHSYGYRDAHAVSGRHS
jgi:hypothetical protein